MKTKEQIKNEVLEEMPYASELEVEQEITERINERAEKEMRDLEVRSLF